MKEIYIVLSFTGTILSKIIKKYTKNEFAHVSISLDRDLTKMYSFGRLNLYNPFIGGFVHEGITRGTFKRFKKTYALIYSVKIKDNQYEKIEEIIQNMYRNKKNFKFNVTGLFAAGFNKQIKKEYSFYCAEFVKYVLEQSNVENNLPKIIKPEDFKNMIRDNVVYKGLLREYKTLNNRCLVNRLMLSSNLNRWS